MGRMLLKGYLGCGWTYILVIHNTQKVKAQYLLLTIVLMWYRLFFFFLKKCRFLTLPSLWFALRVEIHTKEFKYKPEGYTQCMCVGVYFQYSSWEKLSKRQFLLFSPFLSNMVWKYFGNNLLVFLQFFFLAQLEMSSRIHTSYFQKATSLNLGSEKMWRFLWTCVLPNQFVPTLLSSRCRPEENTRLE